jgi:hypothetical protein
LAEKQADKPSAKARDGFRVRVTQNLRASARAAEQEKELTAKGTDSGSFNPSAPL